MKTLLRLAFATLTAAGFATTASAQFPAPIRTFPPAVPALVHSHHHRPPLVIEQPVISPTPVIVHRPPVIVQPPQLPVYCLDTFASDFRPCPGRHHIAIIHPVTKCPVEVCFTLPDCKLREVEVNRRSIEFEYGLGFREVRLEFLRNGTVKVHGG